MTNHPNYTLRILQNIGTVVGAIALVFTGIKFIIQPAYKVASSQERARIAELTSEAYRSQVDDLVRSNGLLVLQINAQSHLIDEQMKRMDMALLYIAQQGDWERRGRTGPRPQIPEELQAALYDIASRLRTEEVPEAKSPFPNAPEEGASS